MIDRLIEALRGLNPPPSADELADALWLAHRIRRPGDEASHHGHDSDGGLPAATPPPETSIGPEEPGPGTDVPPDSVQAPPEPTREAASDSQAGLFIPDQYPGSGHLIRAPAPPAIPHALPLTRALRPLRVTRPSRVRNELDETATAQRVADTGMWQPIMRPSPERSLNLALVVDNGTSMAVWRQTAEELQALLEQLGAFRDIRLWRLDTEGERLKLHTGAASSRRNPDELIDPTGRRVVLVVTDCVSAAWQDGRAASVLDRWARSCPVAIVHVLPQRLWRRSAMRPVPVRFEASGPELPNDQLTVRPRASVNGRLPSGVAIPVMELEPRWLAPWAQLVGAGGRGIDGVALFTGRPASSTPASEPGSEFSGPEPETPGGTELQAETPRTAELEPLDRVKRFRAVSSPQAFRLATYLAAAPLRLPVMRLVQQAMLPDSKPAHLAEVFLGDLMIRVHRRGDEAPDETEYDFRPGVRDVLLAGLQRGEALRVLREVWDVMRNRIGSFLDFPALLGALERDENTLEKDKPFAQVTAHVLMRLGGRYRDIGMRLAQATLPDPSEQEPEEPATHSEERIWGGVPPQNPDFTGRETLLDEIHEALGGAVTALLPHPLPGLGGEGKSQLAVEYAYRHAGDYDLVWWIPAEQLTLARSSLAALSDHLGTPLSDDIMGRVDSALRALRTGVPYARWLLIYDNAGDPAELSTLMPVTEHIDDALDEPLETPLATGDIIVTSRDPRWSPLTDSVGVGVFTRAESIEFLQHRVPRLQEHEADALADRVGDLPLAVEQVAAWHAATDGTAEEYLRQFDEKITEPTGAPEPADGLPTQLVVTLDLSFERLRRDAPSAAALLELCAFFGAEPVGRELLTAGASWRRPEDPIEHVHDGSPYGPSEHLPEELGVVLVDGPILEGAMREISRFALARFDQAAVSLQVHRLVRAMLQTRLSIADQGRLRRHVHRILVAATPQAGPPDETTWAQREKIKPHVVPAQVIEGDDPYIHGVALDQMLFLWVSGDFEGSRLLAELAHSRWRERYGPDNESTLEAGRALGNALRSLGHIREAAVIDRDVRDRMKRVLGPDHLSTLYASNSLAADLRYEGAFVDALEVDMDAWSRMRARFGSSHDRTLPVANNVGLDLRLLGDFQQAYELDNEALRTLRGRYGDRHRSTLLAIDHLAQDLHGLGRYREALEAQLGSLETRREVLGAGHLYVLNAAVNHAGTLRRCGQYTDAADLAFETLEAHTRRFGEDHPETLTAKRSLVLAWIALGSPAELRRIRELSEEALAGYRRMLGEDHPFTQACAADLGIALRRLGDYQAALTVDQAALTVLARALGEDHYYSLCCSVGLVNDLYLLGEFDAAFRRSGDTVLSLRARLGPVHPFTLAAAHNHGVIQQAIDGSGAAAREDAEPLTALRQVLGPHHPEVDAAAQGRLLECEIEPMPL